MRLDRHNNYVAKIKVNFVFNAYLAIKYFMKIRLATHLAFIILGKGIKDFRSKKKNKTQDVVK